MSLEEWQQLCQDANFLNEKFTQREVDLNFNLAMMTQLDEISQDRHYNMTWVEFIEALARAADLANLATPVIDPAALKNSKEFRIIGYLDQDCSNLALD